MPLIPEKAQVQLKESFKDLVKDIRLIVFTQEFECEFCKDCRLLMNELSAISERIKVEMYDLQRDSAKAAQYKVDKIPAIAVVGEKDCGTRFFGLSSGYEFAAFIETVMDVSRGESRLSETIKKRVKSLKEPVHIQVLVTPTCPYCPKAVRLAHQMAIESDYVTADMVESTEFPQLTQRYRVMAVPKIVVNDDFGFEGAFPEEHFVEYILSGLNKTRT